MSLSLTLNQCEQIGHNFANFGEILKDLGYFLKVHIVFELWQIWYALGNFFSLKTAKFWKHNLVIWSHCIPKTLPSLTPIYNDTRATLSLSLSLSLCVLSIWPHKKFNSSRPSNTQHHSSKHLGTRGYGYTLLSFSLTNNSFMGGSPGLVMTTHVQKVVGSNPGAVYWDGHLDMFSHWFVVNIALLVSKDQKINKKRPGLAHLKNSSIFYAPIIHFSCVTNTH